MIIVGLLIALITILAIITFVIILIIKKIMNNKYSTHEFSNFWPGSDIKFKDYNKRYKETKINDNRLNILFGIIEIIYYITRVAAWAAAIIFIIIVLL